MRAALLPLLLTGGAQAFAPPASFVRDARPTSSTRVFGVDPSYLHDHISILQDALSSLPLADAVDAASDFATDATASVADAVTTAAPAATDAATDAAQTTGNGWFGFLTTPIEGLLQILHSVFVAVAGSSNAWGISIIFLTLLIKAVTFPLTKTQLESTNKMQAMQPAIKEIQTKYQSNQEVMNQKVAEFYQANDINPLAGCIPSLVQIPVFIGLYRAVLTLAKENQLDEPFLWLPNLEGPTYGADPAHGSDWILKGWVDGAPSLGWDDTIAFLILPVFLVISQFVSMELMQPKNTEQQPNIVLKLLPLMIGWFSLNVPAALCIYWVTNNIVTTATSLVIRGGMNTDAPVASGSSSAAAATMEPPASTIFAPPREKPSGFSSSAQRSVGPDDIKPITAIDAEVVKDDVEEADEAPEGPGAGMETAASKPAPKKKGRKQKKRKRN